MTKDEFYDKYLNFIFERVLCLKKNDILFVSMDKDEYLENIINKKKQEYFLKEVHYEYKNTEEKNKLLLSKEYEEIKESNLFNCSNWNVYALRSAKFLILEKFYEEEMIDAKKLELINQLEDKTKSIYDHLLLYNKVMWSYCFIPTLDWYKKIYNTKNVNENDIYEFYYHLCSFDSDFNLIKENIINDTNKLNNNKYEKLHFVNELGTNLIITLGKNKWLSIFDYMVRGINILPNYPSYEIYTTPDCRKTDGIVYGSRPIVYSGKIIDKYYLKFKDGKVIDFGADIGYELLKEIIEVDEGSMMLGEVSLISNISPIKKEKRIFYNTLLDENADCHIALGMGFCNTLDNSENMTNEELKEIGFNISKKHVDMIIGTGDLKVYGCINDREFLIYDEGKIL